MTGLAVNSTDDIFLTGQFGEQIDFGVTVEDGTNQFNSNVGGGPTALNILTATEQDIFVMKLLANAQHAWSKNYGNAGDQHGGKIKADSSGNIWLAGDFSGTISFGGQILSTGFDLDIYLAKLSDTHGGFNWAGGYGNTSSDSGSVCAASGNEILAAGRFV